MALAVVCRWPNFPWDKRGGGDVNDVSISIGLERREGDVKPTRPSTFANPPNPQARD